VRKPLRRSELADQDLREATEYLIANAGEPVALRFLDAIDETFVLPEDQPEIGRIYVPENPELHDIRAWQVQRFDRYLVFYRILEHFLRVERVLHGSRNTWALLMPEQ